MMTKRYGFGTFESDKDQIGNAIIESGDYAWIDDFTGILVLKENGPLLLCFTPCLVRPWFTIRKEKHKRLIWCNGTERLRPSREEAEADFMARQGYGILAS